MGEERAPDERPAYAGDVVRLNDTGKVRNEGPGTARFGEQPMEIEPERGVMAGFEAEVPALRGHQAQKIVAHSRASITTPA